MMLVWLHPRARGKGGESGDLLAQLVLTCLFRDKASYVASLLYNQQLAVFPKLALNLCSFSLCILQCSTTVELGKDAAS